MHLDLVTPERQLLSEEVTSVNIPGMDGDITLLGSHAPLVTTLRPGILSVTIGTDTTKYLVTGGFAEISPNGASILAESAVKHSDVTAELLESTLKDAETALETAPSEMKAAALQRVNDLGELIKQQNG